MNSIRPKGMAVQSLLGLAAVLVMLVAAPSPVTAGKAKAGHDVTLPDAVLYEVVEDAYFLDENGMPTGDPSQAVLRVATAHLTGWVELGTPLCPSEVLLIYPDAQRCWINATGSDSVSLQGANPGTGPVSGAFSVVVQGDNPTDGPEAVALTGTFNGTVDLSPALAGTPLGYLTDGVFQVDPGPFSQGGVFNFTGTFRLPFTLSQAAERHRPRGPRPAFYLNDMGRLNRVRQDERSISWATVRLEIQFQ